MAQGSGNKVELKIVVNGNEVSVEGSVNAPLHSVLAQALKEADVAGNADPSKWVFKDAQGNPLNRDAKIGELGLVAGALLFLSLEAGAAG
jgi:hypothetical protein